MFSWGTLSCFGFVPFAFCGFVCVLCVLWVSCSVFSLVFLRVLCFVSLLIVFCFVSCLFCVASRVLFCFLVLRLCFVFIYYGPLSASRSVTFLAHVVHDVTPVCGTDLRYLVFLSRF